jgi:hypothetical protein
MQFPAQRLAKRAAGQMHQVDPSLAPVYLDNISRVEMSHGLPVCA